MQGYYCGIYDRYTNHYIVAVTHNRNIRMGRSNITSACSVPPIPVIGIGIIQILIPVSVSVLVLVW